MWARHSFVVVVVVVVVGVIFDSKNGVVQRNTYHFGIGATATLSTRSIGSDDVVSDQRAAEFFVF